MQHGHEQANISDNGNSEQENSEDNIEHTVYDNEDIENTEYDDISVENESPEDAYRTSNDLNTIEQLNMIQININTEARDELPTTDVLTTEPTNHRYNLLLREI